MFRDSAAHGKYIFLKNITKERSRCENLFMIQKVDILRASLDYTKRDNVQGLIIMKCISKILPLNAYDQIRTSMPSFNKCSFTD